MNEEVVIRWLRGNWLAFILAFITAADRRNEGTRKDALVSLWLGLHSSCLAPALTANDTRPPSSTTERHVRADQSSTAEGRRISPAWRRQRAVISQLNCRAEP
jgi:Ni/Co efflux regulator RcnB